MPDVVPIQNLKTPPRRNFGVLAVLVALWLVVGAVVYSSIKFATPPPIKIGKSTCASCGMTIEDPRFAGNRQITRDGKVSMPIYDDLGCMLDADRENEGGTAHAWFVQDFNGAGWIKASSAWYVMNTKNRTPMGSGILAFRERPAASAMTFPEIAKARHAFMKAKYGGK